MAEKYCDYCMLTIYPDGSVKHAKGCPTRKLVRNKSDSESRAFWKNVEAAAVSAPKLKFTEKKTER